MLSSTSYYTVISTGSIRLSAFLKNLKKKATSTDIKQVKDVVLVIFYVSNLRKKIQQYPKNKEKIHVISSFSFNICSVNCQGYLLLEVSFQQSEDSAKFKNGIRGGIRTMSA